jgi:mono/diheme cytochrome c family protein
MPVGLYRVLSDSDATAVAAYLKSLPPTVNKVPEASYRIPLPPNYGPPLGVVAPDKVAYGGYLARIGHCMQCHTPLGEKGQRDYAHQLGAGGLTMDGVFGQRITPNITPDHETGIGGWSDAAIKTALITGMTPDGCGLTSPMPWRYLSTMHDPDIDAIVAYLRTVPPQHHKVQ